MLVGLKFHVNGYIFPSLWEYNSLKMTEKLSWDSRVPERESGIASGTQ